MNRNLNLETSRRHSSTSLPPLRTTRTPATHSLATRLRRRHGRATMALLALLALALTVPVREASAQWPPPVPPPIASTLPATEVTSRSATLNGTVNPGGGGYVWFDWNTSNGYGNSTSSIDIGPGTNAVPFSAPLVGLIPNTTYHFRAAAGRGATFISYGDYQSFTTLPDTVPFGFTISSGAITITGYGGAGGAMSIPSTINGLPVTSIGTRAFYQCTVLISVTIPNSVTSIEASAFEQCTNLTSITIPNSVTNIGDYAFYDCSSLTTVTIPNSITSIGNEAFNWCSSLASVMIPNSVTSIGEQAFDSCTSLTNITIPNSVTNIGNYAFAGCTSLTSVTIPNRVTSIGYGAFEGCTSLSTVTIPNSVTSIGSSAFLACASLTSVMIPNSLTNIGENAFGGCTSLKAISADALNPAYLSIDGVLFNKSQTTLIQCPGGKAGTYTIPNSVTNIGWCAFDGCANLTNIMIPNSVTSISTLAFAGCYGLTSITIPNGVTSLGDSAFNWCTNLTSVMIPNSVTNIGDYAFYYCPSLTGVYFQGNAPNLGGAYVFQWDNNATVYYLWGWGTTFGGRPTARWTPTPPTIQTPPQTQTAEAGSAVDLRVQASGPWISCLWYLNNTHLLICSTSCEIELTNVQFSQSGAYTAVITNFAGAVTSSPAMLQVIAVVERRPVPGIKVTGQTGSLLNVDYTDSLSPEPNWTPLGSVSLTNTSQYYCDPTLPFPPQRFYRAWQASTPSLIPSLDLQPVPAITLTGTIGHSVRLDYINQFGPIDAWVTLATVPLTNSSQLYFDTSAPGQPPRLYRLVLSP